MSRRAAPAPGVRAAIRRWRQQGQTLKQIAARAGYCETIVRRCLIEDGLGNIIVFKGRVCP